KEAAAQLQHGHALDRGDAIGRADNGTEMTDNLAGDVEALECVAVALKQDRIVGELITQILQKPPRVIQLFGNPAVQLLGPDRQRRRGRLDGQLVTAPQSGLDRIDPSLARRAETGYLSNS